MNSILLPGDNLLGYFISRTMYDQLGREYHKKRKEYYEIHKIDLLEAANYILDDTVGEDKGILFEKAFENEFPQLSADYRKIEKVYEEEEESILNVLAAKVRAEHVEIVSDLLSRHVDLKWAVLNTINELYERIS